MNSSLLTIFSSADVEGFNKQKEESIASAAAASGAFLGVFEPVNINGKRYIDGGIVDNDPADLAFEYFKVIGDSNAKVLSLRLNPIKSKIEKRANSLSKRISANLISRGVKSRENQGRQPGVERVVFVKDKSKLRKDIHAYDKRKNKIMGDNHNRLLEIDVQPDSKEIDTLTTRPSPAKIEKAEEKAERAVQLRLNDWEFLKRQLVPPHGGDPITTIKDNQNHFQKSVARRSGASKGDNRVGHRRK